MNPARSGATIGSLPSWPTAKARARVATGVVGQQRGDDLDEGQHRQGVEEVQPQDVIGPVPGRRREFHDRDRRRVRREDRVLVLDDAPEPLEHPELDVPVLDDGLDDDVPVCEHVEVLAAAQPPHRGGGLLGAELLAPDRAVQGLLHSEAGRLRGGRVGFDERDVEPGARAHLADAGAHDAASNDPHPLQRARRSVDRAHRKAWIPVSAPPTTRACTSAVPS